jgi:hypothetical protein
VEFISQGFLFEKIKIILGVPSPKAGRASVPAFLWLRAYATKRAPLKPSREQHNTNTTFSNKKDRNFPCNLSI